MFPAPTSLGGAKGSGDEASHRPEVETTSLTVTVGGEPHAYKLLKDFTGTCPEPQTIRGHLTFAGYGITAPEFGKYDDYSGLNVSG